MLQLPRPSIVRRTLLPLVVVALSLGCASQSIPLTNLTDGDRQWVWPHFIDGQPTALVFWSTNEMECYRNLPALQGLNSRTGSVQLVK